MENEEYKEIWRKLSVLEQHIINLIIPIQNISTALRSPSDIHHLLRLLQQPLSIDDSRLSRVLEEFRKALGQFETGIYKIDLVQTLSEIKYIGKRLNQIEETLSKMEKDGIKKNIQLDFSCDGYEMVKKPANYDKEEIAADPQSNPDEQIKEILLSLKNKKEANMVIYRMGLLGCKKKTYADIGLIMKLSRERCRQIYCKALRKLRHPSRIEKVKSCNHIELKKEVLGR